MTKVELPRSCRPGRPEADIRVVEGCWCARVMAGRSGTARYSTRAHVTGRQRVNKHAETPRHPFQTTCPKLLWQRALGIVCRQGKARQGKARQPRSTTRPTLQAYGASLVRTRPRPSHAGTPYGTDMDSPISYRHAVNVLLEPYCSEVRLIDTWERRTISKVDTLNFFMVFPKNCGPETGW